MNPVFTRLLNLSESYVDEEKKDNRYMIGTFWLFFAMGIVLVVLFLIIICCFFESGEVIRKMKTATSVV